MENKNSPMLPKFAFVWGFAGAAAMLLLALGAFLISSQFRSGPDSRALLGEIQRIGELRTASRTVKNVVQVESALDPPQPLNMIPGARQISHALTKNEAALEYTATIEAGVDLRHASIRRAVRDGNPSWIVSLPPVKVYEPTVSSRVISTSGKLLYNDLQIAHKAHDQAVGNARGLTNDGALIAEARKSAEERIGALLAGMTSDPIHFDHKAF